MVAVVYFAICFGASRYSQWLERRLAAGGSQVIFAPDMEATPQDRVIWNFVSKITSETI